MRLSAVFIISACTCLTAMPVLAQGVGAVGGGEGAQQRMFSRDEYVKKMTESFDSMDTNGDGNLDLNEMIAGQGGEGEEELIVTAPKSLSGGSSVQPNYMTPQNNSRAVQSGGGVPPVNADQIRN